MGKCENIMHNKLSEIYWNVNEDRDHYLLIDK